VFVCLLCLKQFSSYYAASSIEFFGSFFKGAYLPQKLDPKSTIETQYNVFQAHVLSYYVKSTPGWFVWAAPSLQTGAIIKNRKGTYLRQLSVSWESSPALVKAGKN
jgi:hypothetical protein